MLPQRVIESLVGLFLLFAILALMVLAFKVSGLTSLFPAKSYTVSAAFDDIGGLKVRAPVKISGVQIGEVSDIAMDPVTFKAVVKMQIQSQFDNIPDDSTVGILTAGLLGDNYVAITPMYAKTFLKDGSQIQNAHSAIILEKLIGQFIYRLGNNEKNTSNSGEKNANP